MPRLVLILILIPLVAGGGVAGWYFFWPREEPAAEQADAAPPLPVLNIVNMPTIQVSMVGDDGPEQFVTLRFALEVATPADVARVQGRLAHLNSALIETLYRALADEDMRRGRVIDLQSLRRVILRTCERVVGRDVVTRVLIQNISQRQL
jgi:flagellar basal body-associated protein FliL